MTQIIFNTRDELVRIDIDKMVFAIADDNYVSLHFRNGQTAVVCMSLQKLEQLIISAYGKDKTTKFVRIGRKYIVNSSFITHINILKQQLVLSDLEHIKPIVISVSKEALKSLKQTLMNFKPE